MALGSAPPPAPKRSLVEAHSSPRSPPWASTLIHAPVTPITFHIRDRLLGGNADSTTSGRKEAKGVGMILPGGFCLGLCLSLVA